MAKIPFDIKYRPQIESGEYKVETNFGSPVEIVCWNRRDDTANKNIVGIIRDGTVEEIASWNIGGKLCDAASTQNTAYDLFIVTPEPELSEFEERIFKLLRQYKECDIPLTPENIKTEASMLWSDFEKYFFDLYGKDGEGDSALRSFYYRGLADGKAEALKDRAVELTKHLKESGLDENSIEYDLIEFMCNLMDCPNWSEIVETAGLHAGRIKAEAVKDLPRWRDDGLPKGSAAIDISGLCGFDFIRRQGRLLRVSTIEKLPGFKER